MKTHHESIHKPTVTTLKYQTTCSACGEKEIDPYGSSMCIDCLIADATEINLQFSEFFAYEF